MRRLTGWIIGGLVAMALWVPGAGAQDSRQMYQGMRHDWREIHQDRQDIRRDWRDIQRDHYRIWQGPPGGLLASSRATACRPLGTLARLAPYAS